MTCPKCGSDNVTKNGTVNDLQKIVCKDCNSHSVIDIDLIVENVKLAKQKQKYQDTNRIERKAFRHYARVENALTEYDKEIIDLLVSKSFSKVTKVHSIDSKSAGVIHLSDTHFNELVDLSINRFDFTIGSQRLQMFADNAKRFFKAYHVQNILLAITGDLLNSDRRLDELLNMATNRAKATFLAVDLLKSFILDLNKEFNISVACVSGNESRAKDEHSWSNLAITDNYDFTIFNMLKYLFCGSDIKFLEGDPVEHVVNVGGKNILLIHGEQSVIKGDVERGIIQLCGKYAARGITIDFVIFGHLHGSRIGDYFARSSSLVGANSYSDSGLQLVSKASQNLHIITEHGQLHSIKVDLQDSSLYSGYNFDKALESYNPKSADKAREKKIIFEVVI